MTERIPDGAIHGWFNLTYANYLVLPRAVLQSMPLDWQENFVSHLEELHEAFGHLDWPVYDVRALKREREHIDTQCCGMCEGEGTANHDDESLLCPNCDGEGAVDVDRWESAQEAGIRVDPIPHYNRGRTRIASG